MLREALESRCELDCDANLFVSVCLFGRGGSGRSSFGFDTSRRLAQERERHRSDWHDRAKSAAQKWRWSLVPPKSAEGAAAQVGCSFVRSGRRDRIPARLLASA